jgi:hypothetical protein
MIGPPPVAGTSSHEEEEEEEGTTADMSLRTVLLARRPPSQHLGAMDGQLQSRWRDVSRTKADTTPGTIKADINININVVDTSNLRVGVGVGNRGRPAARRTTGEVIVVWLWTLFCA